MHKELNAFPFRKKIMSDPQSGYSLLYNEYSDSTSRHLTMDYISLIFSVPLYVNTIRLKHLFHQSDRITMMQLGVFVKGLQVHCT